MNAVQIGIAIGWLGAISYIAGYLLLALRVLSANTVFYHLINAFGAIGLIVNAYIIKDIPNVVVNLAWLLIGLFAIVDIRRRLKEKY